MAVRTASIKVQIEGYSEYRSTIANLNAQNKLLETSLKDLDREYANDAKNADYLAQRENLLAYQREINNQKLAATEKVLASARAKMLEYENAVAKSKAKLDEINQAIQDYAEGNYKGDKSLEELTKEQEKATRELAENTRQYTSAINEVNKLTKEKALEEQAFEGTKDEVKEETKEVEDNTQALSDNHQAADKLEQLLKKAVGFGIFAKAAKDAKDAVKDAFDSFVDFEAAFTNVEKTVDGSKKQLADLKDEIMDMSSRLPYSTTEISNVASIAGQLGIETPKIAKFTETMLGLGVATNITADEAATMLAQFQNVTGFDINKIDNLSSTIIHLGNNSATTEKNIMEMAQRFASAGTLAGMSAPDILGMATALSSMGVNAEAGGTSLSKLTQKIQSAVETNNKDLKQFAKVAGVSAKDFAKAWRENPVEAIELFVKGLHDTYEEGDPVLQLLDDVGLKEVRLRNAVQALATSEKDLAYYVDMSNQAFKSTASYDQEVGRFLGTTQSSIEVLKNNLELLKIQVGESLAPAFDRLIEAAGDIIGVISDFLTKNPFILEGISLLIDGITALINWFGIGFTELDMLNKSLSGYTGNVERFGEVAVGTKDAINDTTRAYADQTKAIDDTYAAAQPYLEIIQDIEADGKVTREEQEKYNEAISKLQELYPDLNIEIDKHTGKIQGGVQALKDEIEAWKQKAFIEAAQTRIVALYEQEIKASEELAKNNKEWKKVKDDIKNAEKELSGYKDRQKELEDLMNGMSSDDQMWQIYMAEWIKLEDQVGDTERKIHGFKQTQADLEVAMKADKDAINDCQEAIKNMENATINATKAEKDAATQAKETAKANKEQADSYDQSKKAAEGGEKTIKAYINGQQKEMTGEQWRNYVLQLKKQREAALNGDEEAKRLGKSLAKNYGEGFKESSSVLKSAIQNTLSKLKTKIKVTQKPGGQVGMDVLFAAKGGIVDRATPAIVGEAGPEAIIPLKKLPDLMEKMMANQNTMARFDKSSNSKEANDINTITTLLKNYLPQLSNQQVVIDGNRLVGAIAPKMDTYFTNQQLAMERGM